MNTINTNQTNPYLTAFNENINKAYDIIDNSEITIESSSETESKLHNAAVNVAISTHSIMNYLKVKSTEASQGNTSAQQILTNLVSGNDEYMSFFEGDTTQSGMSLESIGYEGKAFTELTQGEAKDLVSDGGFFGVDETSQRVTSFVINMTGDNIEALQESRVGLVQGFEEAQKLFGGELPDISVQTQDKTLEIIDAKIAELLKTDAQKEAE
ncbi:hydrogenase-4 component G [Arcobacter peruensis]|uniref:hydrogenase-4 component G n=1 Tax=Arcobacter peruensis TaxID=2320140 RepID=UPI000F08A59C|nr:hydrogenase-4 component G [Arcobacter peruensis]